MQTSHQINIQNWLLSDYIFFYHGAFMDEEVLNVLTYICNVNFLFNQSLWLPVHLLHSLSKHTVHTVTMSVVIDCDR